MSHPNPLQQRIDAFLSQPPPAGGGLMAARGGHRFSPFRPDDARRATELADEFGVIARAEPDREQAVLRVLDRAAEIRPEDPELLDFALNLFITHDPAAQGLEVTPLEVRAPGAVLPAAAEGGAGFAAPMPGREPELAWFREDAKANEHHEHWHYVFWRSGTAQRPLKDRHGEIFVYMHQQMLARYDAERRALGIDPADELEVYGNAIPEGYDPAPGFSANPGPEFENGAGYTPRPADAAVVDPRHLEEMRITRELLDRAIADGRFNNGTPVDSDSLGMALEPAGGVLHGGATASAIPREYGWLHGQGHVSISEIGAGTGVMANTATAIRDPVFWRWHRHVDDFNFRWQETQDEHDFAADVPPGVRVRDVVLAYRDQLPPLADADAGQRFGAEAFGGGRWDQEFSGAGPRTTDTLETLMCRRTLVDRTGVPRRDDFGAPLKLRYLDQRPFVYFFRLQNESAEAREVTLRVFLVPEAQVEDRRAWIEMDKLRCTLAAGERAVVYRPAQDSAVIRKPAQKPPVAFLDDPAQGGSPDATEENYCTCGWPYNLLVPRGTEDGARYRLMVVATDMRGDRVQPLRPAGRTCGSVSFCGLRDDRYPDSKAMGYPFHRPFKTRGIAETIESSANMASRTLTIRHVRSDDEDPQYHEPPVAV